MRCAVKCTIKDVAKAAGVSPSTVSRALHNNPRISEQARERIRALENLGFVPSDDVLIGHDGTAYGDYYVLYSDSHQKKIF